MSAKVYDGNVLKMAATADTVVGDVIEFEASIGIAQTAGLTGELISVDTVGVYELTAADADAVAVGDLLYWDSGNALLTTVNTFTPCGYAWSTKAGAVAGTVEVKIG